MGFIKQLFRFVADWRRQRLLKKKLEELRKRDPFIYK
jgi:hypothetical protein